VATSHGSPGNLSVKGVGGPGRAISVNVPLTALVCLKVYVAVRTVEADTNIPMRRALGKPSDKNIFYKRDPKNGGELPKNFLRS